MTHKERQELAEIKAQWARVVEKSNADVLPPSGVALWASLNVDRLIALAEKSK